MLKTSNCVIITPEIAKQWLSMSKGNRSISRGAVAKIKADIIAGNWERNGDRIKFLEDGTLYDGHHRLTACAESGMPILTDVFIINDDAKKTIDKGKPRSTADNLVMDLGSDKEEAKSIASAVRVMVSHDFAKTGDWARATPTEKSAKYFTESFLTDYYNRNKPEIDSAVAWAHEKIKRQNTLISKGQAVALVCLASRVHGREPVLDIVESILTGYGVQPGTTADHVRAALVSVKMKQRKMLSQHKVYSIAKAIKSIMAGRNIKYAGNATFRQSADIVPRFGDLNE